MTVVAQNLRTVRARIADAAARAGRDHGDVTLVVVTKGVDVARIREAIGAGARVLGENRVQELLAKRREIAGDVEWHMIGTLQRNKARDLAGHVALIHSVDSIALGEEIARRARAPQPVLLEVNVSGEATKHGVAPGEAVTMAERLAGIEGLSVRGLMTIAAPGDEERARAAFASLRSLGAEVAARVPGAIELSMGMSGDVEIAVEEGATIVRVGSAIFGPRAGTGPADTPAHGT